MDRPSTVEDRTEQANAFGQAFQPNAAPPSQEPTPKPTRKDTKKALKESKKAKAESTKKPTRRERKAAAPAGAVTSPAVAKAVAEQKKRIPIGTRYNGDRKKFFMLGVALIILPTFAVVAVIIALNRPSQQAVIDIVDSRLAASGTSFPTGEAIAWSGQVVKTWATWDEDDDSGLRETQLSQFLSQGMDANAGWNGKGKQSVQYVSVNPTPEVLDDSRAMIDATYQTDAGMYRCLTLSVYAYRPDGISDRSPSAFALAANPTPVACAPRTGAPALEERATPGYGDNDNQRADLLASQFFPGFFAAWAASDAATLGQYVTTDTTLIGLGGAFESSPNPIINSVQLPTPIASTGEARTEDPEATWIATVGVTWTLPGTSTQVSSSYMVELRKMGSQWQVTKEPEPITQQPGLRGVPFSNATTSDTQTPSGDLGVAVPGATSSPTDQ